MKKIEKIKLLTSDGYKEFDSEIETKRNEKAVYNPNDVSFEVYNGSGFDISFQSTDINDFNTDNFKFIVKKEEFRLLRHGNYIAKGIDENGNFLPDGTQLTILKNYGDTKGLNNKKATSFNSF